MIHFIRTNKNRTIIECEVNNNKDLSCSTDLEIYSEELFKNIPVKDQFMEDFSRLDELRGIWWESDPDDDESMDDFVRDEFVRIAHKYGYNYVTD